jgi:hypothetical protein
LQFSFLYVSTIIPPPPCQQIKFGDPRTVIVKEGEEGLLATDSSLFVVPETILAESKRVLPAQVQSRPPNFDHQGLVVDVLSVGSRTRPEYVSYQYVNLS